MPPPEPQQLSLLVKSLARQAGFDLVGIARAAPSGDADRYRAWLAAGKHGAMEYLARNVDERLDVTGKYPWARSVVCVAMAYWHQEHETPEAQSPLTTGHGPLTTAKIARYAWGRDYHKIIGGKLSRLERRLREALPAEARTGLQIRSCCDTAPILEREFAARAGLGWIGKHTLLIHPRQGSWFLLGEMILNLELEPDSAIPDHCGTCRRCIDACPTHAIAPYSVDATKCISYLTLENRGTISEEFHAPMRRAGFIIGCDICQDVCPFNRKPLPATDPDFTPRPPAPAISLPQIQRWSEQDWDQLTRGRASRRAKYPMWQRNAAILADGKTEPVA